MSDGKTTLYAKLAEVTAELGYVPKDGRNDFQQYNYTSAEALLAAVRGPLSNRKLVLMPSVTAVSEREYTTSKGKASVITTAHVSFTIVDGESGESHKSEWAGQGDDPADKGLGKAYTNAIKTFLREQFLIPQGDDPEADRGTDERSADRVSGGRSEPQQDAVVSEGQRRLIWAKAKEAGLGASQLVSVLRLSAGKEPILFETEAEAGEWLDQNLPRFPKRLVNTVVENIAREAVPVPS